MSVGIEISRKLVIVNAASSVARKLLLITVLVWLQQHLVRNIDPEEYQLYPVLIALMMTLPLVTSILMSGLRRYVTDAYARGDGPGVTRLVSSMQPFLTGLAVTLLAIGLLCAWKIADVLTIAPELERDAQIMFVLLVAVATLRLTLAPFGMGFHLRQRFVLGNVLGLSVEVLRIIVLFALLSVSTRVMWVVVASSVASVYDIIVSTIVSRRLVPELTFRRDQFRASAVRPLFTFGGWAFVNQVGLLIRNAADPVILNKLATPVDVGAFYLGSRPDVQARAFSIELASTAQPAVMSMNAQGQSERLSRTFSRLSRYTLWTMAALGTPLIVFRHELFELYLREKYTANAAAATVMALLMARYIVIFPNTVIGMIAVARAEIRALAVRAAAMSVVDLALTLYLVGVLEMGAVGSALATFGVTMVGAPLLIWPLGLKLAGTTFGTWLREAIVPGLLPALIATPAWLVMRATVAPDDWASIGIDISVGALVYVVVLVRFALRPQDRNELRQALGKLRGLFSRRDVSG